MLVVGCGLMASPSRGVSRSGGRFAGASSTSGVGRGCGGKRGVQAIGVR